MADVVVLVSDREFAGSQLKRAGSEPFGHWAGGIQAHRRGALPGETRSADALPVQWTRCSAKRR
jgi:hypothetical protein